MPIYDYQCTRRDCKRRFDELTSDKNKTTTKCVDCGGLAKRVLSLPARPHISGSGDISGQSQDLEENSTDDKEFLATVVIDCPENITYNQLDEASDEFLKTSSVVAYTGKAFSPVKRAVQKEVSRRYN